MLKTTLLKRLDVASTLMGRCLNVMRSLGSVSIGAMFSIPKNSI